jgi:hypothetical protein
MSLYIEIENGQPKNSPAFEDNLIKAFGFIPPHWEPFIRVKPPKLNVYEVVAGENSTYEKINGVWTDVWVVREMTAEEKTAKQQGIIDSFNLREQISNWSTWTLDEATCQMVPPIPRPELDSVKIEAGIYTFWCGADANWKESPARPVDNNQYKFDFFAWQWVQVVN